MGLASAGALTTAAAPDEEAVWDRIFRSTEVTEGGQTRELLPGTRIRMAFHRVDVGTGTIVAETGCGSVVAETNVSGGRLDMATVDVRRDGCADDARFAQTEWLGAFLQREPLWDLDGDDLTLTEYSTGGANPAVEIRLTDDTEVAVAPALTDTYWVIESVADGGTVTAVPAFPEPYLVLRDGEQLAAYSGCNWIDGPAKVLGDAIALTGTGMTKKNCPDYDLRLEIRIFEALSGEVTYSIADGRLTLTDPNGPDLRLRSQS